MQEKIKKLSLIIIMIICASLWQMANSRTAKAEITVANPQKTYVITQTSNVYNSRGKKTVFKTHGTMRGKTVPVAQSQLYQGKFVDVLGTKSIKGKQYDRIGTNAYVNANNIVNYQETKTRIDAEEQNDDYEFDDNESDLAFLFDDLDSGYYEEDPSPAIFDDSGYHNRMIKNARRMLGYFNYGTGKYRANYGSWRHPRKKGTTDCSGFVWLVMKKSGYRVGNWPFFTLPMEKDAKRSHHYLRKISAKNIRPGDVVIANTGNGRGNNGHAAIVDSKYDGMETQIIEMGGDDNGSVHRSYLGSSLSEKLLKGRITFARAR